MSRIILGIWHWLNDDRHRRAVLVGVLATALVLRLAAALLLPASFQYCAERVEHVAAAENVLNHGLYGEEEGIPHAVVCPAYPLFRAAVLGATGRRFLAVRVAQALLDVFVLWLVHVASAGRLFSPRSPGVSPDLLDPYPALFRGLCAMRQRRTACQLRRR